MVFEEVTPAELNDDPVLSAMYGDLNVLYESLAMLAGSLLPNHAMRLLMVGYTRGAGLRERREIKRLCRQRCAAPLKAAFTASEWQEMTKSANCFDGSLTKEDDALLRRLAGMLVTERFNPESKLTHKVLKAWDSIPVTRQETAITPRTDESHANVSLDEGQVMIPTLLAPTYQFAIGTRKPSGIRELGTRSGRFAVVFPGTTRQLEFISRDESYLTTLQKYVNGTLGNPVTSKIVVASLYFNQRNVAEGALPQDIVRVEVEQVARLVGKGAIKSNRAVDPEFKSLYSRTFFVLSTARAVWIPERYTQSRTGMDWLRSPLYHVEYEGGRGGNPFDLEDPGMVTGYRLGDVFLANLYGNGRVARSVAPLDFALYFSWNSRYQADEQCLHLLYTQMFQQNIGQGGVYRSPIGTIMDDAGLTLMYRKNGGERYDRFLEAHDNLANAGIIARNWRIVDKSLPMAEQVMHVEPSETLQKRIQAVLANQLSPLA